MGQDLIQRILKRAREITPRGYITYEEISELGNPNCGLLFDERYKFGSPLLTSTEFLAASTRSVDWVGGAGDRLSDKADSAGTDKRYVVALLVELWVDGKVSYSLPFPATSIKTKEHDEAMWRICEERLLQCNTLQLRLIASALRV
jgi:hypothetical protein